MNCIRQKLVSLQNRARHLQNSLRRWSLYDDSVSHEIKDELLARFTPAEETTFESDLELTKARLRPVSIQLRTLSKWYDYVQEQINEQLDRARGLLDQGRHHEALFVLNDVEARMVVPNEDTLGFVFRAFRQHTSQEFHQKLATIDAIIRDLYLPTAKLAHQRGLLPRESLSRTPLAYITDVPEGPNTWRQHLQHAVTSGRRIPVALLAIPRRLVAQPWSLVAIGHEVGLFVYSELDIGWEVASKLQTEAVSAGVSPQTAQTWARWHQTLFADVFATLKLGPAYVSGMIELLGGDPLGAVAINPSSPVPPAYLRWNVMLQTLGLMKFGDPARELFNQVHLLCGDPGQLAMRLGAGWHQFVNDCRAVSGIIALSPCQKLGGARLVDVSQPFMAAEFNTAMKVKDLLLAGDESCASDDNFIWAGPLQNIPTATHVALAGLRAAFDATVDYETSRRLWIRFWCLEQYLTGSTDQTREQEDREYAPGDAVLKQIAMHAIPVTAVQGMAIPGIGAMPIPVASPALN
ncbi:MAG: hypothetical protein DCC65_13475 [Planctomycetota bacterium]|nr:MAG: hypothetical protein DCC65_13475 [Planctomycetota bacterium]